jgi:hypothetical protein
MVESFDKKLALTDFELLDTVGTGKINLTKGLLAEFD